MTTEQILECANTFIGTFGEGKNEWIEEDYSSKRLSVKIRASVTPGVDASDEDIDLIIDKVDELIKELPPEEEEYGNYFCDEKIAWAEDDELLRWADEAESWDDISLGCLRQLAWRYDIPWDVPDEDDPCDTMNRVKAFFREMELDEDSSIHLVRIKEYLANN